MAIAQGRLVVLSAPSGAGKTTIARDIMRRNPSLRFSVSATTRARRHGEVDGKDYHFLTLPAFRARVDAGAFVEWEEVFGNYYGTLREEVDRAIAEGRNLLFDVDVNGGLSIKSSYPDALLIFISPPSMEVLEQRLRNRGTEDEETIMRRLLRVSMEMEKGATFDVRVVNDDLTRVTDEIHALVERHLSL